MNSNRLPCIRFRTIGEEQAPIGHPVVVVHLYTHIGIHMGHSRMSHRQFISLKPQNNNFHNLIFFYNLSALSSSKYCKAAEIAKKNAQIYSFVRGSPY